MTDLAAELQAIAGVKVLAVGDVMLDRYLTGAVERISPEAPIPVLRVLREETALGGAGNVLRNLVALGADPLFCGVIGDDAQGREVQYLVGEALGGGAHLIQDKTVATTVKQRMLSGGQQLLRADWDAGGLPRDQTLETLESFALDLLKQAGALLLSDYGKGVLQAPVLRRLIGAARTAGLPVVVDPKGRDYSRYAGADFVTPNRRELADASGLPTGSDAEVVAAAARVIAEADLGAVLATRSEQGMTLVLGDGEGGVAQVVHLPAEAQEVFDVSGAGDTVVAAFGAGLAGGLSASAAAGLANIAAGVVVAKRGTAVAFSDELLRAGQKARLLGAEAKIADRSAAAAQAGTWQVQGLTVGFTNGCFDILHPGHLHLLRQARAACDRLIVGLNSDASVRRLKGAARPVQDEAARAAVLASLADVDRVVIFGEDTPYDLIGAVGPDLLVKGADYSEAQVVGADLVKARGGKVLLAELKDGHSTTRTLEKLESADSGWEDGR
ncbi:D-glycero-beta-D-manno-heptose 1-phosphate adenylyltransferase [Algihabitans albus]|uniref:D-glycero-beta-D-manno-heptose 1-phosphate adenylyltransferase n=1 Tax=Algihabitans albus TaxID=2164067 RepID=UPI000E5DA30D|nr:D-glycero-beta-D-manno-heptose 1-phosphate adenylyltransferase [Algihabitans albus]